MTKRILTSCSTLALSVALAASPASAQFLGTPSVQSGTVTVSGSTVEVGAGQAVVNWTPTDNATNAGQPITFLPSSNSVTFANRLGDDFAILNRILPADLSRAILLDGQISSLRGNAVGGTVYFYSPSGVLVGANAVINVGNLGLTSSDPVIDGQGNWLSLLGNGETRVQFGQASVPTSAVVTQAGSSITVNGFGAYVAMVAPRVQVSGNVVTSGAAAFVAAEAATITFRPDNLFDIEVNVGSGDAQGISYNGSTTGSAAGGNDGNRRVYMVAVPKNQAMEMLLGQGSRVGFNEAGAADVDGNAVILSAGHDVANGEVGLRSAGGGNGAADLEVVDATVTSRLSATSTGEMGLNGPGISRYASDVRLSGPRVFVAPQGANAALTIEGNLDVNYTVQGTAGANVTGGTIGIGPLDRAQMRVGGNVRLTALAFGGASTAIGQNGGNGTGGTINVSAQNGATLLIGGNLFANADGEGGFNDFLANVAGNGRGGSVGIGVSGGGSVTVAGTTTMRANGYAGSAGECLVCGASGATGEGGIINIAPFGGANAGSITLAATNLAAEGFGGIGGTGPSGLGSGGQVNVNTRLGGTIGLASLSASVTGQGGAHFNGGQAGEGRGGTINVGGADATGTMTITGLADLDASGGGGSAFEAGSRGGLGKGGNIFAGNQATVTFGSLNADASAFGGFSDLGRGGDASGGIANFGGNTGTHRVLGTASLLATARGGSGARGGDALGQTQGGGSVTIFAGPGASVRVGNALLDTSGFGSNGSSADGGAGEGGVANISTDGGSVIVDGTLNLYAEGEGGSAGATGATNGSARGGTTGIDARGGGQLSIAGATIVSASALAGETLTPGALGGSAIGGRNNVNARSGGTLTMGALTATADALANRVDADCVGCFAGGGNATGGFNGIGTFDSGANVFTAGAVTLSARAEGGHNGLGNGGNAQGGESYLTADFGSVTIASLNVSVDAVGGNSQAGGNGGFGQGGLTTFGSGQSSATARMEITGNAVLSSNGSGGAAFGAGGVGGYGYGGRSSIFAVTGSTFLRGSGRFDSIGFGGASQLGTGGAARGGQARINSQGAIIDVTGPVTLTATATGGDGGVQGGGAFNLDPDRVWGAAAVLSRGGTVTLRSIAILDVSATAGAGLNGGNGGSAVGGYSSVFAQNAVTTSRIAASDLLLRATGTGGAGAAGAAGQAGGSGGSGEGGFIAVTASSGSGDLSAGIVTLDVSGIGGAGSAGGSGATGGNGGAGGTGTGGFINAGTESGSAGFGSAGRASYAAMTFLANASGGAGGAGGTGTIQGNGGRGGDASNGSATLLGRGSQLTVGSALITANATGGDGGSGATPGAGGNATLGATGGIGLLITSRFQAPNQRSSFTIGSFDAQATAIAGNGSVAGSSTTGGDNGIIFIDSDGTIGAASLRISAASAAPTAKEDALVVDNGTVTVTNGLTLLTQGPASIAARNGGLLSAGTMTLNARNFVVDLLGIPPTPGTLRAGSFSIITGQDFVASGNMQSLSGLTINAPGLIQMMGVAAAGPLSLRSFGGPLSVGNITNNSSVVLQSAAALTAGTINTTGAVSAIGVGNVVAGSITSGPRTMSSSAGSVTVGNLGGTGTTTLSAATGLTAGNVSSGAALTATLGAGAMTFGNITVPGALTLTSPGNLTLGTVSAGGNVALTATAGTLAAGGISTSGNEALLRAAGAMTLNGISSAFGGEARSGGLLSLNGIYQSTDGTFEFYSPDIAIAPTASLRSFTSFYSTNPTATLVGDGLSGSGYAISDAELDRVIDAWEVIASAENGAAATMTVGDLSITKPAGVDGEYEFGTANADGSRGGRIRVEGDVVFTGLADPADLNFEDEVAFDTGLLEVNAVTGSIQLLGSGTTPSGYLDLFVDDVRVASPDILARLAADRNYSGKAADLNAAAAVQRPDGVVRAGEIWLYDPVSILVQNTGSASIPAGVIAQFYEIEQVRAGPPGGVEMIVNGQIIAPSGTLTGTAVRQAFLDDPETDPSIYSANSMINGCLLSAASCGIGTRDPVGGIGEEINIAENETLPDKYYPGAESGDPDDDERDEEKSAAERAAEKAAAEAKARAPIAPPQTLVDTGPLDPKRDVNEPVSGSGNPALSGETK